MLNFLRQNEEEALINDVSLHANTQIINSVNVVYCTFHEKYMFFSCPKHYIKIIIMLI